jgi:hypothetical protein
MPVEYCGTVVAPSADTNTPPVPVSGDLLTSRDFGIPVKPRYYLTELARALCRWEEDAEARRRAFEAAQKSLERLCERGKLRGLRLGRIIIIPREEWERYVAENQTIACEN